MAVLLPNSVYIHIPKTGGSTVRLLLKKLELYKEELGPVSLTPFQRRAHMRPKDVRNYTDLPMFTFIRDKVQWYQSIFRSRIKTGHWPMLDEDDVSMCYKEDFNRWVYGIARQRPGFLSCYYEEYTEGVDLVGDTETLYDDLFDFLAVYEELDIRTNINTKVPTFEIPNEIRTIISCLG